jgi:hypothetical protein
MTFTAKTPQEYIDLLPDERRPVMTKLRQMILTHLPDGFEETMSYGMIGYVVPHSVYPDGYHCDATLPLPFLNIASQKNFIALYHSGIYANEDLLTWFREEYPKHSTNKLDMGKSCIRFKNINKIPFDLIAELVSKMSCQEWITCYETATKKK